MKSFEKYYDEIKDDFIFDTVRGMQKQFYQAGAEEMRKSMRCETCKHFSKRPEGLGFCENKELDINNSLVAYDFGCIRHEQKEEKI